jgi:cytochrome c peroxidase
MKRSVWLFAVFVLVGCGMFVVQRGRGDIRGRARKAAVTYQQLKAEGWPETVYLFGQNPLTDAGIALGRKLFYDESLSADGKVSCGSCHNSYTAFAHVDHKLSHGVYDREGRRNAPALFNLAWSQSFMWDGAITTLDNQSLSPIASHTEMDLSLPAFLERVQRDTTYQTMYRHAFPGEPMSLPRLMQAIAQFELTFISQESRYDSMRRHQIAFTPQEQKGYELYKLYCADCHKEPLFRSDAFESNGLFPNIQFPDWGRVEITRNPKDSGLFRVPSLRNVEVTYPYMHDGRFATLSQVLKHYSLRTLKIQGVYLPKPIVLSPNDRVDLLAFLLTLTDRQFLQVKELQDPRGFQK